jgi:hypothetical protein
VKGEESCSRGILFARYKPPLPHVESSRALVQFVQPWPGPTRRTVPGARPFRRAAAISNRRKGSDVLSKALNPSIFEERRGLLSNHKGIDPICRRGGRTLRWSKLQSWPVGGIEFNDTCGLYPHRHRCGGNRMRPWGLG